MGIKVIITGATGLVGEGILLACLQQAAVQEVLLVSRRSYGLQHPKLKECLVTDFFQLDAFKEQLQGYDACFYCAGISSNGMDEAAYTHITYDTAMHFAQTLLHINPEMVFNHVSGAHSDSSEKGRVMWARVKGKTENALMRLPFKAVYNFRPGLMKPLPEQKNIKGYYKIIAWMYPFLILLFPKQGILLQEMAVAMINSVLKGYNKQVLEVKDIKLLAQL